MKRISKLFWFGSGLLIIFLGVREFNQADTWIELVRGLVWIAVGITGLWLHWELQETDS